MTTILYFEDEMDANISYLQALRKEFVLYYVGNPLGFIDHMMDRLVSLDCIILDIMAPNFPAVEYREIDGKPRLLKLTPGINTGFILHEHFSQYQANAKWIVLTNIPENSPGIRKIYQNKGMRYLEKSRTRPDQLISEVWALVKR